jgi:hypothetical protein
LQTRKVSRIVGTTIYAQKISHANAKDFIIRPKYSDNVAFAGHHSRLINLAKGTMSRGRSELGDMTSEVANATAAAQYDKSRRYAFESANTHSSSAKLLITPNLAFGLLRADPPVTCNDIQVVETR